MKFVNVAFTVYRGILYTAIALYLIVAIAPFAFGIKPYMVLSGSMEPEINVGALAYINTKDTDVAEGDIIAFDEGGEITVIHRIVHENDDGTFETKGDANKDKDFVPISQDQIVGTVVYDIPQLGYVTAWLQSKTGIIMSVVLIAIAFLSSFITDSKEETKKTESETNNEEKN